MHHSLQIMSIPPFMIGHLFWKASILGGLYWGVPLYSETQFTLPTEKLASLSFIIVAHNRHNIHHSQKVWKLKSTDK